MEFDIDCICDGPPGPTLAHQVLYLLVSRGCKYNVGTYPGHYVITRPQPDGTTSHTEDEERGELTERLPEIVDEYASGDPGSTTLTVGLGEAGDKPMSFSVAFVPVGDDRTMISFKADTVDIESESHFLTLSEHVAEICRRLDVTYAAYRSEHMGPTPRDWDTIVDTDLQRITYFGPDLIDEIGSKRLRSVPAYEVTELDDGGVFVIVTPEPTGADNALETARDQLSE
ncbi:hypothetical protein [Natrinema salifodinae]|uniref:Uncharacterized protein n=1 Tax=Natrinema salifodinae TaxID=1202768 RepID=A0A1I0QH07_9EURY|nr:hypothetical protein [Natrinema salifodinae]SEW26250.1 hypothetical protein SAMN05216285_3558 [Natrinema salifodinae]